MPRLISHRRLGPGSRTCCFSVSQSVRAEGESHAPSSPERDTSVLAELALIELFIHFICFDFVFSITEMRVPAAVSQLPQTQLGPLQVGYGKPKRSHWITCTFSHTHTVTKYLRPVFRENKHRITLQHGNF